MFDQFSRYQKGLTLKHLFPQNMEGVCACGCNKPLLGRRKRWASNECQQSSVDLFFVVKGDISQIRRLLFDRDNGVCSCCNENTDVWEADHILPVKYGGGACDLDNFQTLCKNCHSVKSRINQTLSHHIAISSQADSIYPILRMNVFGDSTQVFPKASIERHNLGSTISSSSAI